jgi:manganese/zinc/iron transport system substrate-binding protein
MVADIVKNVVGDRARVTALMGAGVDPHLYRPTRDDVSALLAADIVFYNGLNLEGKMHDVFIKIARSGKPVHAVTELLPEKFLLSPPEFEGHDDPHLWMDPNGWMKAAEAVIAKLCEFDSEGADEYGRAGERYLAELKRLDAYGRERLATIPAQRRVLVTAHDAFNYFARAYDLEVRGIQGISTDSEAGLQQIESLVSMLVDRRIPAVFTESSVSEKNVRALVDGARARGHEVRIGGELFSDAMGAAGRYEGTYVGMIDHNITTIVRALGGEAPPQGLNGRLSRSHQ